ncbi:hypothetical protein CHF27_010540 [Romboutsia maritimum]|uniref:Uncharacterized protein n=1 Tax=Romboutsia maritimum TaxID=2020948 RepID=A0A371IRB7_9FIRM|nr:hypothetical protein [Romboutsia maritimum]RDY23020.1 hypothetical protein CHF27_010540 [Romboutsia maritimum]
MSLVSFLSCLYFGFTMLLLFKQKTMGKMYILFGALTYVFIIGYSSIPKVPASMQNFMIFLMFSLMIIIFGIMNGILMKVFKRSDKFSVIAAIISSSLLILVLFNIKGYLTYMYIPLALYLIQKKINNIIAK